MSEYFNRLAARSNLSLASPSHGNQIKVPTANPAGKERPAPLRTGNLSEDFAGDTTIEHPGVRSEPAQAHDFSHNEPPWSDSITKHQDPRTIAHSVNFSPGVEEATDPSHITVHEESTPTATAGRQSKSKLIDDIDASTYDSNQHLGQQADISVMDSSGLSSGDLGATRKDQMYAVTPITDPTLVKVSVAGISQDNTKFKPGIHPTNETARDPFAEVSTNIPKRAGGQAQAKKHIEIKIGKIDLEIHQPAVANKPAQSRPQVRQATDGSVASGNSLSRYYLRGGFG